MSDNEKRELAERRLHRVIAASAIYAGMLAEGDEGIGPGKQALRIAIKEADELLAALDETETR